jgi:T5orf172 domain
MSPKNGNGRPDHPSLIYFLTTRGGDALCKIGVTTNMASRLKQHQSAYPWEFAAAICGDMTQEQAVHLHFAEYRHKGLKETFHLGPKIRRYLDWLKTRSWAASELQEIARVYPYQARWPWDNRSGLEVVMGAQAALDVIAPEGRRPEFKVQQVGGETVIVTASPTRKLVSEGAARVLSTIRSDSDEWTTPPLYTQAAREVMGAIDLDPCSSPLANQLVKATTILTRQEDSRRHPWHGRVWLCPPWGNEKESFVSHLLDEWRQRHVTEAILALNAHATDTVWFEPLWAFPMCLTHHRPRFIGGQRGKGPEHVAPTTGIAFVYVGPNEARFMDVFSRFGPIVRAVRPASVPAAEFRKRLGADADWEVAE